MVTLAALPTAATAADECVGLDCADAQSEDFVPEANGARFPLLIDDRQITRGTSAGFYEFAPAAGREGLGVVYVIPAGELGKVPASVRDLPIVKSFEDPGGHPGFDFGTTVIFGPYAALTIPQDRLVATAAGNSRPARAKASTPDAYGCEEVSFCLYDMVGFTGIYLTLQGYGTGWFNLSQWSFSDRASSMRNRRNNDSLLAEHVNGGGAGYCADSHSSDTSFNDNPIGNNRASSAALVPDDIHC
jgi:hypothetical protein